MTRHAPSASQDKAGSALGVNQFGIDVADGAGRAGERRPGMREHYGGGFGVADEHGVVWRGPLGDLMDGLREQYPGADVEEIADAASVAR